MTTISLDDLAPELETLKTLAEKSGVKPRELLNDLLLQYEHNVGVPVPEGDIQEAFERLESILSGSEKPEPIEDVMQDLIKEYS